MFTASSPGQGGLEQLKPETGFFFFFNWFYLSRSDLEVHVLRGQSCYGEDCRVHTRAPWRQWGKGGG